MGRKPCCEKERVNKGAWSAREDTILMNYIRVHGEGKWRVLPKRAGLNRCGKSCRLRWLNYLRPDIKRGNISTDEEELIIKLHKLLGNRWSLIAGRLPGRTDNEIKNYWNTTLSKRLQEQQIQNKPSDTRKENCSKLRVQPAKSTKNSLLGTDPMNSSPPVIRTKAVRCTKVIVPPIQAADDSMNNKDIITRCWESQSPCSSTPQDDIDDKCSGFLVDFDISDLLQEPGVPARPCASSYQASEINEQCEHLAGGAADQINGHSNSHGFACVKHLSHFVDETSCSFDDSIGHDEARPENNWMVGGFFQPDEAVDLSSFLSPEHEWNGM